MFINNCPTKGLTLVDLHPTSIARDHILHWHSSYYGMERYAIFSETGIIHILYCLHCQ